MRGVAMIDAIQGPPRTDGPDVLLRQTSFRALAEPRRFRDDDGTVSDGTLRVRFGEVEARGVALTPEGRRRYDAAMATADPAAVWRHHFPGTHDEMAASGLAYYHGGDPAKPVVYEDFLPASAAGIFRSNLDSDTARRRDRRRFPLQPRLDGRTDRPTHSRSVRALRESRIIMTTMQKSQLPTADDLRARVRDALAAVGSPARARRARRRRPAGQHPDHGRRAVHDRRDQPGTGRCGHCRSSAGVYVVADHPGAGAWCAGGAPR